MLPHQFELLLQVLQAPDDDGPRLVYADVMQERGEPHGEFVALQCGLARWSSRADPEAFEASRQRAVALLAEHGELWERQQVPLSGFAHFHRGFVESLQCLPAELLAHGLEVVAPLQRLGLDGDTTPEVAQQLLAMPVGMRVKELTLHLVPGQVEPALVGAARPRAIRQLATEADAVALLKQMGWLEHLERLELPVVTRMSEQLEALGRNAPKLRWLGLHPHDDRTALTLARHLEDLFGRLPEVKVRWRGLDYGRAQAQQLGAALAGKAPERTRDDASGVVPRKPSPVAVPAGPFKRSPWSERLAEERLEERGFLPRALPFGVSVVRARDARARPCLLFITADPLRIESHQDHDRVRRLADVPGVLQVEPLHFDPSFTVSEPFEGVTLWELQQLHPRLSPPAVLRALAVAARVFDEVEDLDLTLDDVLLGVDGLVRVLGGFPRVEAYEERNYTGLEERHLLGMPSHQVEGARLLRLGVALFDLLTGTPLLGASAGLGARHVVGEWHRLGRELDHQVPPLAEVDPALARFQSLLEGALSHGAGRFSDPLAFAQALEAHPDFGTAEEVGVAVKLALGKVPRTRDGR